MGEGTGEGSERGVLGQAQAHSVRRRAWASSGLVQCLALRVVSGVWCGLGWELIGLYVNVT